MDKKTQYNTDTLIRLIMEEYFSDNDKLWKVEITHLHQAENWLSGIAKVTFSNLWDVPLTFTHRENYYDDAYVDGEWYECDHDAPEFMYPRRFDKLFDGNGRYDRKPAEFMFWLLANSLDLLAYYDKDGVLGGRKNENDAPN